MGITYLARVPLGIGCCGILDTMAADQSSAHLSGWEQAAKVICDLGADFGKMPQEDLETLIAGLGYPEKPTKMSIGANARVPTVTMEDVWIQEGWDARMQKLSKTRS